MSHDMFGTQHLALFIVSGLLLNITPGQDTLYIVGRSVSQGRRAGLLSVLGISTGSVVHTLAAAFGLSAIFATSAAAFTIVKMAGAAYLVYLGVKMLLDRAPVAGDPSTPLVPRQARDDPEHSRGVGASVAAFQAEDDWSIYRAGLLTNVLNPKVALFFMAFLPQFVSPAAESRVLPFLFLGGLFVFNGTLWCLVLVWGASAVSQRLRRRGSSGLWLKRASGAIFVGLGVRLAVSK